MENANIVYGRLTESIHISGYSLERAITEFKWLLEDDKWKKIGTGFEDINDFLKSISFKEFKLAIEQRKEIAKQLEELQASQRATAKMLGVSKSTVNSDLNESVQKRTVDEVNDVEYEDVINDNVQKRTTNNNDEIDEFINNIPGISTDGKKVADKNKKTEEKIHNKKEERNKLVEEGSKIILTTDNIDIRLGDFSEVLDFIPDNSIDLILTDPPYPYEFIECWSKLGTFAEKKLKDGGFLIAYSGHAFLPEVINRVLSSGMKWYWLGSCLHTGAQLSQVFTVNMFAKHKPILFFYKGEKHKQNKWLIDVLESKVDDMKEYHEWGQTTDIFDKLIKTFEPKIVVDPFLGGGTTAIACIMNQVKFIGAEIDESAYNISKKRIYNYGKS